MGAKQRNKGAVAEREVAKLLSNELGTNVTRNLLQAREGGYDLDGLTGWALEVKRQENLNLTAWWKQTVSQAQRTDKKPVLAYRQSRKPWRFVVRLNDINHTLPENHTAQLDLEGFCLLVRKQESLHFDKEAAP